MDITDAGLIIILLVFVIVLTKIESRFEKNTNLTWCISCHKLTPMKGERTICPECKKLMTETEK